MIPDLSSFSSERSSRFKRGRLVIGALLLLLFLPGCAVEPTIHEARDVITLHFEGRGFSVRQLKVGAVSAEPLGERKYMEPRGYLIDIEMIILEAKEAGATSSHHEGTAVTFQNATVKIHRDKGNEGRWIISNITGIPLQ